MADTKIPYADKTWTPVVGCTRCAHGCKNCWAVTSARRLAGMADADDAKGRNSDLKARYRDVLNADRTDWNGRVVSSCEALHQPFRWRKPRRVAVCFMGDLWHRDADNEIIGEVFDVMKRTSQHTYLVFTKRIKRAAHWFDVWMQEALPNVHLYFSASIQSEVNAGVPWLLKCPAAVRGVSLEPLLGPITIPEKFFYPGARLSERCGLRSGRGMDLDPLPSDGYLNHVIIGCESIGGRLGRLSVDELIPDGPAAWPYWRGWCGDIVDQCREARVPVYVKQIPLVGKLCKIPALFPEVLRRQELPTQAKGT